VEEIIQSNVPIKSNMLFNHPIHGLNFASGMMRTIDEANAENPLGVIATTPASTNPSQRCSLRNSPRWSSARYRGPEMPQQGLHTPVPVVLKYYTTPSNVVAPTPPMCYRWKMFAENWSAVASNRHSPGSVTKQIPGLVPMEDIVLWSVNRTEWTA
jgi:hypothetical protein